MLSFPFNAYCAAAGCAFTATVLAAPLWRAWCRKSGLMDDPGHRKIHAQPVALAGGLAVFTGLLAPVLLALLAVNFQWLDAAVVEKIRHGLGRRQAELAAVMLGAAAMLALGWFDDKYELGPGKKFSGQLLIALGTALAGVRVTLFVDNYIFSLAITVLWILTVTNALNFTDNMNGLCAGLAAISAGWFAAHAMAHGHYLVALLGLAAAAALAGFLPYNYPKASMFLGDSGSHLAGYLLAVLGIMPHFHSATRPNPWAVLSPLLILAVPLADLAWVVLLRAWRGKPVYVGDTNHFSHRLARRGFSQRTAVALLWLAALAAGGLSMLLW